MKKYYYEPQYTGTEQKIANIIFHYENMIKRLESPKALTRYEKNLAIDALSILHEIYMQN